MERWQLLPKEEFTKGPIMRNLLLSSAILSTFIGCAVGPDFKEPQVPKPEFFLTSLGGSTEIESNWWKSFGDSELQKLIDDAVTNNKDIDRAVARLKEARAGRRATQFDLAPIIPINGSVKKVKDTESSPVAFPGIGEENETYTAGFDATWELDIFGRVRRSVEGASARELSTAEELKDAIHSVIGEVARNYFELRGIQNQLAVARRNAENQVETVRITEALVKGGQATELDTARAQSQYKTTLASIPTLEGEEKATIYRLSVLTGALPGALVEQLSKPKPLPTYDGPVSLGTPADLIRRRPDIRSAEAKLAAATADIGVATADLFPRITFLGSFGFSAINSSEFGDGGTETYSFGPQISWAALNLGSVYNNIQGKKAAAEGALAFYEQTVLSALQDIESTLSRYTKEKERFGLLKEAAAESARASKLARTQYQAGLIDFLAVLDSERATLQAEDALAKSQTTLLTGLVAIYKSLGGGWAAFELKAVENPEKKV